MDIRPISRWKRLIIVHGIRLYCLLENATHLMQAADIGLFSPLKSSLIAAVKEWQIGIVGMAITKKDFPAVFKKAWDKVAVFGTAASAARRSGMLPFSSDAICMSRLGPSLIAASSTHYIY
ncbi:hypothetical protein DPMN_175761 [Dreissena polymorpha]|uniref:Uncharacterized protein n=1 Tax=Dreissena polymorpha TaxID=45954 RepID=A0A9D4IIJ5_DREPO|nr:hypothetical protein DPMN_175761 [Dreissena polymorpha]